MNALWHCSNKAAPRIILRLCGLTFLLAPAKLDADPRRVSDISDAAYPLLAERVTANRTSFFVYRDANSGLNHGFPSGFFGSDISKISLDAACIDDPNAANGCSTDPDRLDRGRGTVLSLSFDPLSPMQVAGVNVQEPETFPSATGTGYDLSGAERVMFDVRSPTGLQVQFGVGGCVTPFVGIPAGLTYTTMSIPINSLGPPPGLPIRCPPDRNDVHILFTVVTNADNAPNGGTVLLDNIRFEPLPTRQQEALSFPLANEAFGVIPLQNQAPGRVPIPPDQLLRNLTTIYESALTLLSLIARGTAQDLSNARLIADTFHYALRHDNRGLPLPLAPDGSAGLHNAYESGDIALLNDQAPGAGQAGDVRLAGFSASAALCGPSRFCLVLDGATGGNNAFAILALLAAHRQFNDPRYLDDARTIGEWIAGNLTDPAGTGFAGYFVGYPDQGVPPPKPLIKGKSVENNADIFAAFSALAAVETRLGSDTAAARWTARANVAGDFVMEMFDSNTGCFFGGTVPAGTPPGPGIAPTGPQRGEDVINTFGFLDANTFATLALAAARGYRNRIDWRRPVRCMLRNFAQSITVGAQAFRGFNIVEEPTAGPDGIAWEFSGQAVVTMRFVDDRYGGSRFSGDAAFFRNQIRLAQRSAPFGDGRGLVASTLQDGDGLPPLEQCLSTPFQCIPERVGLAATTWAIFADRNINPLGNDRCDGRVPTLLGTAGNDRLRGTAGADVIHGLDGNDKINGLAGNDLICGGPGTDVLNGGRGRERLFGGPGGDRLRGGPGSDRLVGQDGNDALDGGTGTDRCDGGLNGRAGDRAAHCEKITNVP